MKKKLTRKQKVEIQENAKKLKQNKLNFKIGIGFLVAGLVFLAIFGNIWLNRNKQFVKDEMVKIEGTVSEKIYKKWRRKGGHYVDVKLNEYPNAYFRAGNYRANYINVNSLNEALQSNKTIKLTILKSQENKLNTNRERRITLFGIEHNRNIFLSLTQINRAMKKYRNSIAAYILLAFSFWLVIYGIRMVLMNRTS